jgi:DNA-binding MarR family transcriptional regulator
LDQRLEGRLDNSRYNEYYDGMKNGAKAGNRGEKGTTAQKRGHRRRVGSAEETAFLDLLRTCDILSRRLAEVLKPAELSPTQYNVLRILRGAKEALTCGEIASRLITRDPDITRLLDRMEKRGLVSRSRETKDRRVVLTRITREGLKTLADLDGPIQEAHRKQLGHLGAERLRKLAELLSAARGEASLPAKAAATRGRNRQSGDRVGQ